VFPRLRQTAGDDMTVFSKKMFVFEKKFVLKKINSIFASLFLGKIEC